MPAARVHMPVLVHLKSMQLKISHLNSGRLPSGSEDRFAICNFISHLLQVYSSIDI